MTNDPFWGTAGLGKCVYSLTERHDHQRRFALTAVQTDTPLEVNHELATLADWTLRQSLAMHEAGGSDSPWAAEVNY